jgi:formyltetrahydrofolate deformylase
MLCPDLAVRRCFSPIAEDLEIDWRITDSAVRKRVVILVSRFGCLRLSIAQGSSSLLTLDIKSFLKRYGHGASGLQSQPHLDAFRVVACQRAKAIGILQG